MKITLLSDIHLDISGHLEMPGGDVLIIAGDACEARMLTQETHATRITPYGGSKSSPCFDFFNIECAKYNKVFYVMGNHEHYRGKLWKTYADLKSVLPEYVTLLENESVEYGGVLFVGATLWTDMNRSDPITMSAMTTYMSDYRVITNYYPQHDAYHKLRPMDTVLLHLESKRYIEEKVKLNADLPVVVITHMGPTHLSINAKYAGELSNGAYVSDLSNLILDNPNIKTWVHGHVHDPVDYMMGDTRVLCNPRGYIPWEAGNGFDPACTFEV